MEWGDSGSQGRGWCVWGWGTCRDVQQEMGSVGLGGAVGLWVR